MNGMKIKLNQTLQETAVALNELGYRDNELGNDKPVFVDRGCMSAIKSFDDDKVAVSIEGYVDKDEATLEVYRYKGYPRAHASIRGVRDHKKYTDETRHLWRRAK